MTDSIVEARRVRFEQAMDAADKNPGQWLDGKYQNAYGQAAWVGYNAALDSLVIDLPAYHELHGKDASDVYDALCGSIHAAGVKTK